MPIKHFLQRLVWACLLPIFMLAIALAGFRLHGQYQSETEGAARVGANLGVNFSHLVRQRIDALTVLAGHHDGMADEPLAWKYRHAQVFRETYDSHVILTDLQRRIVFHTRLPLGAPMPELPMPTGMSAWELAVSTGAPAVSDLVTGPTAGMPLLPVMALAVPVMREGRPVAVLLSVIPQSELQALLDQWRLPAYVTATLLDGTGEVIARREGLRVAPGVKGTSVGRMSPLSAQVPWTLDVALDNGSFRAALALEAAQLLLLILLAAALVSYVTRRAGLRLQHAVSSITEPIGGPDAARPAAPEVIPIREVVEARQQLETLSRERDAQDAAWRQSESRLRDLLGAMPDAVWITTDHRIEFANPAAQRLVGVPLSRMIDSSIFDFLHPDSVAQFRWRLPPLRDSASDALFEDIRFLANDGVAHTLLMTSVSLDLHDGRATLTLARDVGELHRTRSELARSNRELVSLVGRLGTVEEEERRRIARELHDDLQQKLGVITLDQQQAEQALPPQADAARAALERARQMTASAVDSVRRVVRALRPQALDDLGLAAALELLVRDFSAREQVQVEWELISPESADAGMPEAAASGLYRIAQEALQNVHKHAGASFVHMGLDLSRPGSATLFVADDGRGFDASAGAGPGAFGLLGMQERMRALGGSLRITATPGGGTRVEGRLAWPQT
jgi:PAS domain S-box-containing protein